MSSFHSWNELNMSRSQINEREWGHTSGFSSMNRVINSLHSWLLSTTISTPRLRRRFSSPKKVRFSPITTRGILYRRTAPEHILHGLEKDGSAQRSLESTNSYLNVVYWTVKCGSDLIIHRAMEKENSPIPSCGKFLVFVDLHFLMQKSHHERWVSVSGFSRYDQHQAPRILWKFPCLAGWERILSGCRPPGSFSAPPGGPVRDHSGRWYSSHDVMIWELSWSWMN